MLQQIIDESKNIVEIDSSPYAGVAEVTAQYAKLCERLELPYIFINEGEGILVNPQEGETNLLIYNSLETKEPGPHSLWETTNSNPYEASISSERLYGLGVASSKLSLLHQVFALAEHKKKGKFPRLSLFGGSYSDMDKDLDSVELQKILRGNTPVLVSRPTTRRVLKGICGKAKVRFTLPLGEKEAELKSKHFFEEDTATQTRIFRGVTTHGASPQKAEKTDAFRKLLEYLEMLPQGVLVLTMEAGHSTDQLPAEAVLELNLSKPVDESVSNKLLKLVKALDLVEEKFSRERAKSKGLLPSLNMGKLRHSESSIHLDVSFFLPREYSKEEFLTLLNNMRSELAGCRLTFELRQFLEGIEFIKDEKFSSKFETAIKTSLDKLVEGESVIESVARKLHQRNHPCIQFGIGAGLGNIDEPNEYIELDRIKDSLAFFDSIMEKFS